MAATTQVINVAIVVERQEEGHALPVQRPMYFISEVLSETKTWYPQIQKLLYAVILARRKLRHYFEGSSHHRGLVFPPRGDSPQPGGHG